MLFNMSYKNKWNNDREKISYNKIIHNKIVNNNEI